MAYVVVVPRQKEAAKAHTFRSSAPLRNRPILKGSAATSCLSASSRLITKSVSLSLKKPRVFCNFSGKSTMNTAPRMASRHVIIPSRMTIHPS